jgi:signal transduction histidine kinase
MRTELGALPQAPERPRPSVGDVTIAITAVAVALALTWRAADGQQPDRTLDLWGYLLVAVAAGVLVLRRSTLVLVMLSVTIAAAGVYLLAGYPYGPVQVCVGWAMFEVARQRPLRVSAAACAVAALVSAAVVLPRLAGELDVLVLGLTLWAGCWLVVPWSVGALVYVRSAAAARARSDLVERVALEERIRLAREVHDVVGHGLAATAMQAGVALVVIDEQPDQARACLEGIRTTSIDALNELRGVLGAAREDGPAPEENGLGDLAALVDRACASGLPVELRLDDTTGVPADLGGVAYRVVRESLTNVMRHAGRTTAEVTVGATDGHLVVAVADRGHRSPPAAGRGHGIPGMRDRVEAAGGSFTAGPRDGGGFEVTARIPLPGGGS